MNKSEVRIHPIWVWKTKFLQNDINFRLSDSNHFVWRATNSSS